MWDPVRERERDEPTPTPPAASLNAYQLSPPQHSQPSGLPLPPVFQGDDWRRNQHQQSRPSSSSSSGWHGDAGFVQPMPPLVGYEDERRRSGSAQIGRGSMPPPPQPQPGHGFPGTGMTSGMYRTTSGESEHSLGRPGSGYARDSAGRLSGSSPQLRRSSHASSPSIPPGPGPGGYFPSQYAQPSPSSIHQASPRTSIAHLLTPSDPPRPQQQPFASTPSQTERDVTPSTNPRSAAPSMEPRGSLTGWTDTQPLMRKITPSGSSIASMMNPPQPRSPRSLPLTKSPTPPPPPITSAADREEMERPMTRTPPSTRALPLPLDDYRSPTAPQERAQQEGGRVERRGASEMEISAAEALSALAGMTPRGPEREREREEFVSPKSRADGEKREEFVSPKSAVDLQKKMSEVDVKPNPSVDGDVDAERDGAKEASVPKTTPRKRKASAVAEDGGPSNGKAKKRTVKEKPNGQPGSTKPSAPPAEAISERTAYNPHRISDPRSVLQPITRDELLYIRNPRNIRNPLKTFRPRIIVPQDEPYPDPPPETREPVTEEPRVIERGGDKRGVQVRQLGRGRDGEEKRGREESVGREEERKRPKVEHGKGFQVADHYNKRGNQGVDNREKSTIIGLRSCNNWIKAVMIQTYIRRRPDRHWNGFSPNGRVLDMGCGKGGDIQKWDRANIGEYVGCDVAAGSIEDFRLRLRKGRRKYPVELFVLDCFRQSILEIPKKLLDPTFDNVSMQFCIHYAFEKVQNVRQMLENVAMYLREGGIYFGTTVSKGKIVSALSEIPEDSKELVIKNDYFRMEFSEREHEGPFGHAYKFTLLDAIDECEEYVVDWEAFTTLAAEYKLKCIYRKDFDDMFAEHIENAEFFALAKHMKVIDQDGDLYMDPGQWAAVSMYLGFAFEKMPISWNPTRDLMEASIGHPGFDVPQ